MLEDEEDFTRDLPLNMSDDEVKGLLLAYPAEVSGDEYRALSQAFCREFGSLFVFDECSFKPNQFMFYPSCAIGAVGLCWVRQLW